MRIELNVSLDNGETLDICGDIVDIAPHLASVATFIINEFPFYGWEITNVESGCRIGDHHPTKNMAILRGKKLLSKKTIEHVLTGYKKAKVK